MRQDPLRAGSPLKTPRAAAVAGIIFSVLLITALTLLRLSAPPNPAVAGKWLTDSGHRAAVAIGLNLVPFAGIAFLWFVGVLRDRIGEREDRFFATVFLGSGLLFVCMIFVAAAVAGANIAGVTSAALPASSTLALDRNVATSLLNVYSMRMAAVFTLTTVTIARRTQIASRWLRVTGLVCAVVLMVGIGITPWVELLFPLWILALSLDILAAAFQADSAGNVAGSLSDMATGRRSLDERAAEHAPAAERGEHWWPVAAAIIIAAGLHVALPARYRVQPVWLVPAVLLALLAVLILADPGRIDRQKAWLRVTTSAVIAVITLANLLAAVRLVIDILTNNKLFANHPGGLLAAGAVIWATNVIAFALWYWDLDRGGAAARAHQPYQNPAFVFPEMQNPDFVPAPWVPRFVDYLSLAFWTATAISPTDISAIRPWAKLLMMLEASGSIVLAALVIARAINVL
jgi:hypothetical protein